VCERLLAVQAQDPRGFRLAVRARSTLTSRRDVDARLDDGTLVVSWLNRGTLHLVTAEDYWLLHPLTAPRISTGNLTRLRQEGVSGVERGVDAIVRALVDGPLGRRELREVVARAGVRVEGQALVHVLVRATVLGHIVRGPVRGAEQAYVLVRDWLPAPPVPFDRDKALAECARRYLVGHAPADPADFAKWLGVSLGDARRAFSAITPPRARRAAVPPPRLLGAFDPVLCGWTSRAWVLGDGERQVVQGGMFRQFALVDGGYGGVWRYERGRVSGVSLDDAAAVEAFLE
jgi:hypothetical protein